MGASSQRNAIAQKPLGPSGSDQPGKSLLPCEQGDKAEPTLAQTVTPQIAIQHASRKFHGKAAPERDEIGTLTLKAHKAGDALGYKEAGQLSASSTDCTFYSDSKCKKKIDPAAAPVSYKFGSLEAGVTLYYKGRAPGSTDLRLSLAPPKDGRITVQPPAVGTVSAERVLNVVKPQILLDAAETTLLFPDRAKIDTEIHTFQAADKPPAQPKPVAVKLSCTATISVEAYDKPATVAIAGGHSSAWLDAACKKPAPGNAGFTVSAADIRRGYTFYLRGESEGEVEVSVVLEETDAERAEVDIAAASARLEVKSVNRVSPLLRVEHLVVLRDPQHTGLQRKDDSAAGSAAADATAHIHADATRLELSAQQGSGKPAYTGKAQLVLSPAHAKAFEDKACTKPFDLAQKIDFDKLVAVAPLELFLRGETAGKFSAELKLDDSADARVHVDGPAKGEMGCVELKLKLHHHTKADVDQAVNPDVKDVGDYWKQLKKLKFKPTEMSAAERVGTGRMLHVQKDGRHARAKLELVHAAGEWPAAAKDYKIVLDAADADKAGAKRSGAFVLHGDEEKSQAITLPHRISLAQAKGLKPMWLEGATPCDGWRGVRLSAGFERSGGGPAHERKLDGDWAALTVLRIKEVKLDLENEGAEKFVDGDKVFINLDDNGRVLKSVGGSRKAEVTATLEPALKDVEIHFAVVEHADNYKLKKLPDKFAGKKLAALKHDLKAVDRDDRKKLLTMSAKTDDKGIAKIETLQMPQMALLKFRVGAYLLQDPQQACYIEDHPDLKRKAPELSTKWWEVWRRLFFKLVVMKRFSGASYEDRFDKAGLVRQMADRGIEFEMQGSTIVKDHEIAVPNFLTWARNACGGSGGERTLYLGMINGRGDVTPDLARNYNLGAPGQLVASWDLPYIRFHSVTDKARWLTSCTLTQDGADTDMAAHTTLTQTGDFAFKLQIDCTAFRTQVYNSAHAAALLNDPDVGAADAAAQQEADQALADASISISMIEADSSSGVSWYESVVVCMDTREPDTKDDPKDSATHTFLHEMGHYLGLAGKFMPDESDTPNDNFYSELGGEVSKRGRGGYGKGPHCDGLKDQCILWYMFKMTHAFCPVCDLMLRARKYRVAATAKVNGRDKF